MERSYLCAKCVVRACRKGDGTPNPKLCPMNDQELLAEAMEEYKKEEIKNFYINASLIEGLGQFQWMRVKETMEFARRMGYHKIGIAFCGGFHNEAKIMTKILERNGFEVVSIMCKAGGNDKTKIGIPEELKVKPGNHESMCNPIFQAKTLNKAKTDFNIVMGLCVGHDSLFYKYAEQYTTTLAVKDRVLAHNPCAALYLEDHYYVDKLDLEKE